MSIGPLAAVAALASTIAWGALAADNDSKPDRSSIVYACDATHNACLEACQGANSGVNVLSRGLRLACENKCTEAYAQCINSASLAGSTKAPGISQRGAVAP